MIFSMKRSEAVRQALGFCWALVLAMGTCSCQAIGDRILKGRPANPPPYRFSGEQPETVEVVEWVHPHAFRGKYSDGKRDYFDIFIEVEKLEGYRVSDEGEVVVPWWIGVAGMPGPGDSSEEARAAATRECPPGTEVVVSFPLKDKAVVSSGQRLERTVLVYNGYLIRIEGRDR